MDPEDVDQCAECGQPENACADWCKARAAADAEYCAWAEHMERIEQQQDEGPVLDCPDPEVPF